MNSQNLWYKVWKNGREKELYSNGWELQNLAFNNCISTYIKLDLYLKSCVNINFKYKKCVNLRVKILRLLEENIMEYPHDNEFDDNFTNMAPKA